MIRLRDLNESEYYYAPEIRCGQVPEVCEEVNPRISCTPSVKAGLVRLSAVGMLLASVIALGVNSCLAGISSRLAT